MIKLRATIIPWFQQDLYRLLFGIDPAWILGGLKE